MAAFGRNHWQHIIGMGGRVCAGLSNCHPPESVHVVEQIVDSFKKGKKDVASFWINMKGERLLIQYFAIRDENGNYKGVVEVSQEITEIQNLKGEKRLLDWDEN